MPVVLAYKGKFLFSLENNKMAEVVVWVLAYIVLTKVECCAYSVFHFLSVFDFSFLFLVDHCT